MAQQRTSREEELMIEVERLRAWLYKIKNEAWKETRHAVIEWLAEQSLVRSHCVTYPDWGTTENWARLGVWPPMKADEATVEPPDTIAG
jgi:hypothetical protein